MILKKLFLDLYFYILSHHYWHRRTHEAISFFNILTTVDQLMLATYRTPPSLQRFQKILNMLIRIPKEAKKGLPVRRLDALLKSSANFNFSFAGAGVNGVGLQQIL